MKISIASDHGAYALKELLKTYLTDLGHTVRDFGTNSVSSCDYPEFIAPAARVVANGECERGIVLCTTGIGASIVANKVRGARCALVHDTWSAKMTRMHNNTNVLAMGAGIVGEVLAKEIVSVWLGTPFDGEGDENNRHSKRVAMIDAI